MSSLESTMAFTQEDSTPIPFRQLQSFKSIKRKLDNSNLALSCSPLPSQAQIDALVARDMNELTGKEREQVLHDIHGVVDVSEEAPLEIERKLADLEAAIQRIAAKSAYQRALIDSAAYVKDRLFRLKFLRAERFDAESAARRLTSFFEQKLKIFGPDKLVKDITLDDLDHDDLAVLKNGHMQFLPQRDMAGRFIFCDIRSRERYASHQNLVRCRIVSFAYSIFPRFLLTISSLHRPQLRAVFYMLMAQSDDEDAQRKGIVGVVYNFSLLGDKIDPATILRSVTLRNSLPIRFAAIHYCFNHPSFANFINYERCSFDKHTRARCRAHKGIPCLAYVSRSSKCSPD